MNVKLTELGLAYRRVKADLYYARHPSAFKLVRFERNLCQNLEEIQRDLNEENVFKLKSISVGHRYVPKSLHYEEETKDTVNSSVYITESSRRVKTCEVRIIEDVPIEFHVVTQLWIDRVGGKLERYQSENSFGYRLREHGNKVNKLYPGSFKNYLPQYKKWHEGGISSIEETLKEKKDVVALTADFSAFYHNLSARFLLNKEFLTKLGVGRLSPQDRTLTFIVVSMLDAWAASTPIKIGLPVGCSISSVIANLAATFLDRELESLPGLISYGRHVDDIILSVENKDGFKEGRKFLTWLVKKTKCLKDVGTGNDKALAYCKNCVGLSEGNPLLFHPDKTKVFIFNKEDGTDFISGLRNQIKRRSSEWRALPDLPDKPR